MVHGIAARRGRPSNFAARRDEIIASAVSEMLAHGVLGVTHASVAARLGLTPNAVAYYFRSREDLAEAALSTTFDALDEVVDAAERTPDDDVIPTFVHASLDLMRSVREGMRPEIPPTHDLRALNRPELNARYTGLIRRLAAQIARDSTERRSFHYARGVIVLSNLPWLPSHWIAGWRLRDFDLAGRHIVDLIEHGFLPPDADLSGIEEVLIPPAVSPARRADQEFLITATRMINNQGYRGASVEKISAYQKVTKGSLYFHYESKDDLIRECFRRTFEIMWAEIDRAEALGGNGASVLVRLCAGFLAHQLSDAPLLRTTALATLPNTLIADLTEELRRVNVRLACVLSEGVSDGSLRPINPVIGAEHLSLALNMASTIRFWHPRASPSETARSFLLMIMKGIRAG